MKLEINVCKRLDKSVVDKFEISLPDSYTCLLEESYIKLFPYDACYTWNTLKHSLCMMFEERYMDRFEELCMPMEKIFIDNRCSMEYIRNLIDK